MHIFPSKILKGFSSKTGLYVDFVQIEKLFGNFIFFKNKYFKATRNREKRKGLITGIQRLLDRNDTYVRRLEEYDKKLAGEIIE